MMDHDPVSTKETTLNQSNEKIRVRKRIMARCCVYILQVMMVEKNQLQRRKETTLVPMLSVLMLKLPRLDPKGRKQPMIRNPIMGGGDSFPSKMVDIVTVSKVTRFHSGPKKGSRISLISVRHLRLRILIPQHRT